MHFGGDCVGAAGGFVLTPEAGRGAAGFGPQDDLGVHEPEPETMAWQVASVCW